MPGKQHLTIDGRDIPVSNLDKMLYPVAHFTKAQVIDYYIRIAKFLLPHLHDRPVTLKRFPDGVGGQFFYEKDAADKGSGRTMDEIHTSADAVWQSNRGA